MILVRTTKFLILYFAFLTGTTAFAWGERGHDLVARVAVRILMADNDPALSTPFAAKEHMMGHLANIPDTMWRNDSYVGKDATKSGGPAHYIDLEYLATKYSFDDLPMTVKAAEKAMADLCKSKPEGFVCPTKDGSAPPLSKAGSSPWRIEQFYSTMTLHFKTAKALLKSGKEKEAWQSVNQALLAGGLGSHFVGDLGNPYHTTRDYNGWEVGQGGVHKYIEAQVVDTYDFSFDQDILAYALKNKPVKTVLAQLPKRISADKASFKDLAFALSIQSFSRLQPLARLDKEHCVLKPSKKEDGLKIEAQRKPPSEVASHFREILVERVATAADTLAFIWKKSWIDAGKPDLSSFASWDYFHYPEFVELTY